jgi:hypothetical protein
MASKSTLELINLYIELHAERRTFSTKNEYLAWRSGLLAGLVSTLADNDSLIRTALIHEIRRLGK